MGRLNEQICPEAREYNLIRWFFNNGTAEKLEIKCLQALQIHTEKKLDTIKNISGVAKYKIYVKFCNDLNEINILYGLSYLISCLFTIVVSNLICTVKLVICKMQMI